jgi:hypothetical protein
MIDLSLTPAEAFSCEEIRRPEDMERIREKSLRMVGKSYFFVDVSSLCAHLSLRQFDQSGHSCQPKRHLIPGQSVGWSRWWPESPHSFLCSEKFYDIMLDSC